MWLSYFHLQVTVFLYLRLCTILRFRSVFKWKIWIYNIYQNMVKYCSRVLIVFSAFTKLDKLDLFRYPLLRSFFLLRSVVIIIYTFPVSANFPEWPTTLFPSFSLFLNICFVLSHSFLEIVFSLLSPCLENIKLIFPPKTVNMFLVYS